MKRKILKDRIRNTVIRQRREVTDIPDCISKRERQTIDGSVEAKKGK